jgi:hypothetical protein
MCRPNRCKPATAARPGANLARLARLGRPALLLGALVLGLPVLATGAASYRVAPDPGLAALAVRACFPDGLPEYLECADQDSVSALRSATLEVGGQSQALAPGRRIAIPAGAGPGCLVYRVDLSRSLGDASHGADWHGPGWRGQGAVLVSPRRFLWAPPGGLAGATLAFDLPDRMGVSAPWEPASATPAIGTGIAPVSLSAGGAPTDYAIGPRPADWDARVALGRFERFDLKLPGGRLEVAVLPGDPPADRARVEPWLRANADALSRALTPAAPRLPVARLQVLVVPVGHGAEPVPWGEVMRGGGDAVHLYIDQTQPQSAFLDDWVLIHELSHLLHPYMEGDGRWLYEGIASYYQNILPARAGWRTSARALALLHAGFRRGQKGTRPGQTLTQARERMLKERAFMRVYWSGAAIALLADLQLRQASGGARSLDWALAELKDREGPYDRRWTAREVIEGLDRVTGTGIFSGLAGQWLDSDRFPDLRPAYRDLGIQATSDTEIRLSPEPHAAALRRSLLGGRPGDSR